MIRKAEKRDLSRIAEILVFDKRITCRPIFQNDDYSFNELQVLSVAEKYATEELLDHIFVYDDGIVKGMIHIEEKEIAELYVDYFFQREGIGSALLRFAVDHYQCDRLWAVEKNVNSIAFYKVHGFYETEEKILEEGTTEYLIRLRRKTENQNPF